MDSILLTCKHATKTERKKLFDPEIEVIFGKGELRKIFFLLLVFV